VPDPTITVTGNTVIDALLMEVEVQRRDAAVRAAIDAELGGLIGADWAQVPFVLITGHRRENFGTGIEQICEAIATLARRFPDHRFVYPVHLNPNVKVHVNRMLGGLPSVRLLPPQGYRTFVALLSRCRLVLTDSGGVQEETTVLGVPCLTLRENTERPVTITHGTNTLVGFDPHRIRAAAAGALASVRQPCRPPLWDGLTSTRVAAILLAGTPEVEWMPPAVADRRGGDAALIGAA
jgi:UDP-N-acetylglucosamine 2-epimerase (non-hydrolysing)